MAPRVHWTDEMDEMIIELYHELSPNDLADRLNVTKSAMLRRARKLGVQSKHDAKTAAKPLFLDHEDHLIKTKGSQIGAYGLSLLINRSEESIRMRAKRLKIKLSPKDEWSEFEDQFLIELFGSMTYEQIGTALDRGKEAVRKRALILGLTGRKRKTYIKPPSTHWSAEEREVVRENMVAPDFKALSFRLDRTEEAVRAQWKFEKKLMQRLVDGKEYSHEEHDPVYHQYRDFVVSIGGFQVQKSAS